MSAPRTRHEWSDFLTFYASRNSGRATRLGVFERADNVVNDYWLESGSPLNGITLDTGGLAAGLALTLGSFTHEIKDPITMTVHFSLEGDEDGLDIVGADGRTTVLRFEKAEKRDN